MRKPIPWLPLLCELMVAWCLGNTIGHVIQDDYWWTLFWAGLTAFNAWNLARSIRNYRADLAAQEEIERLLAEWGRS